MILVATKHEYGLAKERFKDEEVVITGVGGLNVVKTLMDYPKDMPIINFGYVGSNKLPIGTEVKVGRCGLYHPNVIYDEPRYTLDGDVPCYTSNDFVLKTRMEEPCIFDMELAHIMALGFTNVQSIKIVSDNLSLKEYERKVEEMEEEKQKDAVSYFDLIKMLYDTNRELSKERKAHDALKEELAEFKKYLANVIGGLGMEYINKEKDEETRGYLIQRANTFKEVLKKLDEIMEVKDNVESDGGLS